jgi:hypothetical protein
LAGEWAAEPRAFDPLNPGDAELCSLYDEWRAAWENSFWGQAAELRLMYLQLLRRKDEMKRRERLDRPPQTVTLGELAHVPGEPGSDGKTYCQRCGLQIYQNIGRIARERHEDEWGHPAVAGGQPGKGFLFTCPAADVIGPQGR